MQFVNMFGLRVEFNGKNTVEIFSTYTADEDSVSWMSVVLFVICLSILSFFVYRTYVYKIKRLERERSGFMKIYNQIYASNAGKNLRDNAINNLKNKMSLQMKEHITKTQNKIDMEQDKKGAQGINKLIRSDTFKVKKAGMGKEDSGIASLIKADTFKSI